MLLKIQLFKQLYLSKVISIFTNISKICITNTLFKQKIIEVNSCIKHFNHALLYDYYFRKLAIFTDAKLKKKDKVTHKPSHDDDMFKCRKCNSRSCSYEFKHELIDEPMTKFISCLDCGSRWRPKLVCIASFNTNSIGIIHFVEQAPLLSQFILV